MNQAYSGRYETYINQFPDNEAKIFIIETVVKQMDYYSINSAINQKKYRTMSTISIILNGLIPIIVLLGDLEYLSFVAKLITASASAVAGILTAVIALSKYKELWLQYRVNLELLKSVMNSFFTDTGDFSSVKGNEQKKLDMLVSKYNTIVCSENEMWHTLMLGKLEN